MVYIVRRDRLNAVFVCLPHKSYNIALAANNRSIFAMESDARVKMYFYFIFSYLFFSLTLQFRLYPSHNGSTRTLTANYAKHNRYFPKLYKSLQNGSDLFDDYFVEKYLENLYNRFVVRYLTKQNIFFSDSSEYK